MKVELEKQKAVLDSIVELVKTPSKISSSSNLLKGSEGIWILGAGKASVEMAQSLIKDSKIKVKDGIIITNSSEPGIAGFQVFKGSHPYPDQDSVAASYELLQLARKIPAGDTVVFCLSGGASSLFCIPPLGIEIDELAITYKLLLNSGASIKDINVVRKHLCELKGGQLSQVLHSTNLVTLIKSDVPRDDLEVIGSAPTICDSSTFEDVYLILKRFKLLKKIPLSVKKHIKKGVDGRIPDTPKPFVNDHPNHEVKIVSRASILASDISQALKKKGYNTWVADEAYDDDVRIVSKMICSKAISVLSKNESIEKPAALIFYGESTVNVKGNGKGGRNQELALISAISVEGQHSISMLSIGTDGIDGETDVAGAIINSETTLLARKKKLSPEEYLQDNDSFHFHDEMNTHVKTGVTGNNLMDLQVLIIE